MARTEDQMIAKSPIVVKLGEKEYTIPVLTILPSREWRVKLNESMASIVDTFQVSETANADMFSKGLTSALIQFPEKMADLVFAYAGVVLPKDEVLAAATEEQMGTAFSRIMEVAYPLVPLAMAMKAARPVAPPASAKYSN